MGACYYFFYSITGETGYFFPLLLFTAIDGYYFLFIESLYFVLPFWVEILYSLWFFEALVLFLGTVYYCFVIFFVLDSTIVGVSFDVYFLFLEGFIGSVFYLDCHFYLTWIFCWLFGSFYVLGLFFLLDLEKVSYKVCCFILLNDKESFFIKKWFINDLRRVNYYNFKQK